MKPITLHVPKQHFRRMLSASLMALLVPLWLLGSPVPGSTVVACLGIAFLLVCAVYVAFRLGTAAPMLVIDDTGLTDNATALGAGLVRWDEISRAEIASVLGQEMLTLHMADTPAFFARMHPLKRLFMRMNAALTGGAPVNLPLQALDMERGALLAAVRARLPA